MATFGTGDSIRLEVELSVGDLDSLEEAAMTEVGERPRLST